MSKFLMAILLSAVIIIAGTRSELSKTVVKPDTVMKIEITKMSGKDSILGLDTARFLVYDTIKYIKILKDTAIVVKIDSIKTSSKPVLVPIKKAK